MMCQDVEPLIDAYVDGELDLERALAVEAHVVTCAACSARLQAAEMLARDVKSAPYFVAPPSLRARLRPTRPLAVTGPARRRPRIAAAWLVAAASITVAAVGLTLAINRANSANAGRLVGAVIDRHLASLMADHLTDVASSDRHTVKPWFAGRVEFAPPVADLAAEGFPLKGGRLDVVDGHSAIALVYSRGQHVINVFTWPTADADAALQELDNGRGYHLMQWTASGFAWWMVSDVSAADLRNFATRLAAENQRLQRN